MSAEPTAQVDLFAPSLVEATTRRLRDEILSGALAPGARLIEEQICQRFSISRAPLRESLRLLVQQGLVEHLPRRGARVTIWSDEDIRQLFEIRAVLERHAIVTALPLVAGAGSRPAGAGPGTAGSRCGRREDVGRRTRQGRRAPRVPRRHRRPGRQSAARPGDGADPAQAAAADGGQPAAGGDAWSGRARACAGTQALLTALETNDRDVVLEALCEHGGQRYLQFRRRSPVGAAGGPEVCACGQRRVDARRAACRSRDAVRAPRSSSC